MKMTHSLGQGAKDIADSVLLVDGKLTVFPTARQFR